MDDIGIVKIVNGFGDLVDDVFFMFFLKNISFSDKSMKVNIHMFED